jgi:hypothetical protein
MNYADALATAIERAKAQKCAYIVRFWSGLDDFMAMSLVTATVVGGWEVSTIAASVDHEGNVTESKWILDKKEVAA